MATLSIGELAELAGLSTDTLRYYERAGLLTPPPRTSAGHRRYGPLAIWELRVVQSARGLGFSVREIRQMLDAARAAPAPYDAIGPIIARRRALLRDAIQGLRTQERRLREAVEHNGGDACTLIVPGATPGYPTGDVHRGGGSGTAGAAGPGLSRVDRTGGAGACACILIDAETAPEQAGRGGSSG